MFGLGKWKPIAEEISVALFFMIESAKDEFGEFRDGFWEDAYILGYLSSTIAILAEMGLVGYGQNSSNMKIGQVQQKVLSNLSGIRDGSRFARMAVAFHNSKDQDFETGLENARIALMATIGDPKYTKLPEVKKAKRLAKSKKREKFALIGDTPQTEKLSGAFQEMFWFSYLEKHYNKN